MFEYDMGMAQACHPSCQYPQMPISPTSLVGHFMSPIKPSRKMFAQIKFT
jgi:hypothetical protein